MKDLGSQATIFTSDANHFASFPDTAEIYNHEKAEDGTPFVWIKTFKYKKTASIARVLSWFDFEFKLFRMDRSGFSRPDVVLVSSLSIFSIVYGYFLKKKYNAKLVFEIRDIWPLTMTEEGGFHRWHPLVILVGWVEKFGYRNADLIVGTMPGLYLHVKQRIGQERPFFCAPLGFNPENYVLDDVSEKNPFDHIFPKDKMVVGYAGSMGITNALEPFIATIAQMREKSDIHFVLVGSGDLRETYKKELQNCDNVTFLERISQDDVKYFLQKCDLLYLSTKDSKVWDYGQSMNKIVEYMLAGKPILASYTGYPSMINEAGCGEFINSSNPDDIQDKIIYYAGMSAAERNAIGEKGKEWIYTHRQYHQLAKEYINAIKSV